MGEIAPARTPETQLFRDVFHASPIGIAVENMEGEPLFVNPAFCLFLGFSEEELRHKHCVDFSPPEDAAKDWALFQQLRAGAINHYQLEKRYFRRDGSLVWGSLSISLLNGGAAPLVIAMVEDITEKKTAEEHRFRHAAIVESSDDAIISEDLHARITGWNAGAERIFGYTEAEVLGQPITILIPPELRDEERKFLEKVRGGGRVEHYETTRLTKTSTEVAVSLTMGPIRDSNGEMVGFTKIANDITQRRKAERDLRESEEKFRSLFRDAGVGMVIVSLEGRFLAANRTFCDYLGYAEEELRERTVESITLAEDWPAFSRKLNETLVDGKNFRWFEKRCLHKSGRIVYTESSASLIRGTDGTPQYFVGEVLDVTSRKEAEAALLEMAGKLIEAQEQERARIGRELHDDITQRIALVAIELEQLKRDAPEADVAFHQHIHHLREQLLDTSKDIQSLSHRLHSSKLEYLGLDMAASSFCRELSKQHKVEIDFSHDGVSRSVPQEVSLCVYRVLQEALQNGVKHSGVRHFDVKLHGTSEEIQLTVSDSGIGFDPQETINPRGLGLISMRERVRLLNGKITVQSKPRDGTTIHVSVPFTPAIRRRKTACSA